MKIIRVSDMTDIRYIVRHWSKWYVLLSDGGLISIDEWFTKARGK